MCILTVRIQDKLKLNDERRYAMPNTVPKASGYR